MGEKRIGVAVSDLLGITAQGVETIWSKGDANNRARIGEICRQYDTDRVLVGLPKSMDGTIGPQAQTVMAFAETLKDMGLQVQYQDERLSTASARRALIEGDVSRKKRKDSIDKLAAVMILQTCLDAGGWQD